MKRIGILSDTHSWLDPKIVEFFKDCDEVWHCGDIGDEKVSDKLEIDFNFRAVFGNIDGYIIRRSYPQTLIFTVEGVKVIMTHIGGYPGKYAPGIQNLLLKHRPNLFVCGHSHIAKVMYDKTLNCLHINPGAAGRYGFHKVRTAMRFVIDEQRIKDLEVAEFT
ncbi:MAG: metallophosphoesterase family protein [Marinifilaceae bacterium]